MKDLIGIILFLMLIGILGVYLFGCFALGIGAAWLFSNDVGLQIMGGAIGSSLGLILLFAGLPRGRR